MAKQKSARQQVREIIRQLRITDGQILLIHRESELAQTKTIQALAGIFNRQGLPNCILIVVDDFGDLSVINEEQMNEAGWMRRPAEEEHEHAAPDGANRPGSEDPVGTNN